MVIWPYCKLYVKTFHPSDLGLWIQKQVSDQTWVDWRIVWLLKQNTLFSSKLIRTDSIVKTQKVTFAGYLVTMLLLKECILLHGSNPILSCMSPLCQPTEGKKEILPYGCFHIHRNPYIVSSQVVFISHVPDEAQYETMVFLYSVNCNLLNKEHLA